MTLEVKLFEGSPAEREKKIREFLDDPKVTEVRRRDVPNLDNFQELLFNKLD